MKKKTKEKCYQERIDEAISLPNMTVKAKEEEGMEETKFEHNTMLSYKLLKEAKGRRGRNNRGKRGFI